MLRFLGSSEEAIESWVRSLMPPLIWSSFHLNFFLTHALCSPSPIFSFIQISTSLLEQAYFHTMQQSSRDQAPLGVRLPLAKFSYTATALNSHARMVWTHVNGNGDLFCEIEERVAGEWFQPTLILKVVQNDKTLV